MITLTNKKISLVLIISTCVAGLWWYSPDRSPISAYRPEDQAAIVRIFHDNWYLLVQEGSDFSLPYMFAHRSPGFRYPDNINHILVYRDAQKTPVGFVTYHKLDVDKARIHFLAVDKSVRKKGYGKALIIKAIEALENDETIDTIEITVRSLNTPAKTLYESLGFETQITTPDGFLIMEKKVRRER
jgi:ribosomal protein S18 acetylase RimI-like enzyme